MIVVASMHAFLLEVFVRMKTSETECCKVKPVIDSSHAAKL